MSTPAAPVPVEQMQRGLEKALQRASQADDRELAGRVRDDGHRLLFLLSGLTRTSHLYAEDNAAFEGPASELSRVLAGLLELLGAVHLVCVEDQAYLNDVRLRIRPSEQVVLDGLLAHLRRHGVGGISFHGPLGPADLRRLTGALSGPEAKERPRAALAASIALPAVELAGRFRFRLGGEQEPVRREHAAAARRGAAAVHEAMLNLAASRVPNPLPVRRAVIDLVDMLRTSPERGAAESVRAGQGSTAERHLVSVCGLAVLLGQALGLPGASLSDLGVAAMLHDAGYTRDGSFAGHTSAGARLLARQRGFHEAKVRRVLVALEHHLPGAGRGEAGRGPSLLARIVHIADDYDVLTAGRSGAAPVPPAAALAGMWARRGTEYDPDLLALFVQALGPLPPGTLMELSDGRWAVSVSGARDRRRFGWPLVRVVREKDGTPADASQELDLSELRALLRPARVLGATPGLMSPAEVIGKALPAEP